METKNISTKKAAYTVTTKKTKCNGKKFKGFIYTVEITDGKHKASFENGGESSISLENFIGGENMHGSRFYLNKENGVLWQLERFGKKDNNGEQAALMMEFIKSVLHIGVKYADGVLTYTA